MCRVMNGAVVATKTVNTHGVKVCGGCIFYGRLFTLRPCAAFSAGESRQALRHPGMASDSTPHTEQLMQRLFGTMFSRPVVTGALPVSLVVGCVLNLINQGEAIFSGEAIAWGHVVLNFLVPYAVSSYSAARNQLSNKAPR